MRGKAGCAAERGAVGGPVVRWRLVSAPSIPGLLSLDPSADPTTMLSSLTMGTEVEVQFGRSLQAPPNPPLPGPRPPRPRLHCLSHPAAP